MGAKSSKRQGPESIQALAKNYDFTREEFNEWTDIFRNHSGDKKYLTESEFTEVYSLAFSGDPRPFIRHVFRSFDVNNDGTVDIREFLTGISCSTSKSITAKLEWAFSVYDVDGNGQISKLEMISIIHAMQCMTGQHKTTAQLEAIVDDIFHHIDNNNDQTISREEFYLGVKNDHRLLEILDCEPQNL